MKPALAVLLLASVVAAAEENAASVAPSAPAAEVTEKAEAPAPKAELPKPEAFKDEAPKAEPEKVEAPKPEASKAEEPKITVTSPKLEETKPLPPAAVKSTDVSGEWAFARSAAEDADAGVQDAADDELILFARRHPDAPQAPDALSALAAVRQKKGDWQGAAVALLRSVHEYPESKGALRTKSAYLELIEKKASRRQRQPLNDLVAVADLPSKADRLSALWQRAAVKAPDALYEPLAAEIREFSVRFPEHADGDKLQAALARLHAANGRPAAALLAWRKLLALFPASGLRALAQKEIGDLYAEPLRDPKKAIDAYQELFSAYPDAIEVQGGLESSARLFEEKLRQYDLAVEMDEKLVKGFARTPAALRALKAIARLQRERLAKPDEAIKTLLRISSLHGGQDGVDALLLSAEIARRDLKDYAREAELRSRVAADYASSKEAPQALYDAAAVYEGDLKETSKAIDAYRLLAEKFPAHKLGKKAADRAAKLTSAN